MLPDFEQKMSENSDEVLLAYITNRTKYIPEVVALAIAELQKRGHVFAEKEFDMLQAELKDRIEKSEQEEAAQNLQLSTPTAKEPVLPEYYSENAIFGFSVFCSVLFGSILLAINLNKTESKQGVIPVIGYGLLYTIVTSILLQGLGQNAILLLLINGAGGFTLNRFFWQRYIGKGTPYKVRSIKWPLIVTLVITVLLIIMIIYGGAVK